MQRLGAVARDEQHRRQIEQTVEESRRAKLALSEGAGPMLNHQLLDTKSAVVREDGQEPHRSDLRV
jgi:hypothetical protein